MPHYSRQSSRSLSPRDREDATYEEEVDEFGRVKQRRSKFTGDNKRRTSSHEERRRRDDTDDGEYSDDHYHQTRHRRRSLSPDRKGHYHSRRRHHSRSISPASSIYSDEEKEHDDDDEQSRHRYLSDDDHSSVDSHHRKYRHRSSRRGSSASPRRHHYDRHRRDMDGNDRTQKKIYIGDLVAAITSSELEQAFSRFGHIKHIKLIEGKEYGFITFEDSSSAQEAISTMDGALVGSQKIRVNRAKMMERSRYGTSTWMDEDGEKSYGTKNYPAPSSLDLPPIQRTLTSYDDLL